MISTHVLDLESGQPAQNVNVHLEKQVGETWNSLAQQKTSGDGRIVFDIPHEASTYRLSFDLEAYFEQRKDSCFFVQAPVIFKISDTSRKYHIPLLLSPFGYSTYRGS